LVSPERKAQPDRPRPIGEALDWAIFATERAAKKAASSSGVLPAGEGEIAQCLSDLFEVVKRELRVEALPMRMLYRLKPLAACANVEGLVDDFARLLHEKLAVDEGPKST
jgi:hypothetical protein